ncbi:hypothetical protein BN1723_020098, partial [Verticillium longisporum]
LQRDWREEGGLPLFAGNLDRSLQGRVQP